MLNIRKLALASVTALVAVGMAMTTPVTADEIEAEEVIVAEEIVEAVVEPCSVAGCAWSGKYASDHKSAAKRFYKKAIEVSLSVPQTSPMHASGLTRCHPLS